MKAAVLLEIDKDLEVRADVRLAYLRPGQVRIETVSSGVCHSDLSLQNGTLPSPLPAVLGHEGAGIVREVGDGVYEATLSMPEAGAYYVYVAVPSAKVKVGDLTFLSLVAGGKPGPTRRPAK